MTPLFARCATASAVVGACYVLAAVVIFFTY